MKDITITIDLTKIRKAWDRVSHVNLPKFSFKKIYVSLNKLWSLYSYSYKEPLNELLKVKCSLHYDKTVSSILSVANSLDRDPVEELQTCWFLVLMFAEKYPKEEVMYRKLKEIYWYKYNSLGLFESHEVTKTIQA